MQKLKIVLLVFLIWLDLILALLMIGDRLDFNTYIAKQQSIQRHYAELELRMQQQERMIAEQQRTLAKLGGYDKCQKEVDTKY